jgi:hypothetical protein
LTAWLILLYLGCVRRDQRLLILQLNKQLKVSSLFSSKVTMIHQDINRSALRVGMRIEAICDMKSQAFGELCDNKRHWHSLWIEVEDTIKRSMNVSAANSNRTRNRSRSNQAVWINVTITADDAMAIDNWNPSDGDLLVAVCSLAAEGYDVRLKPDSRSDGFSAFLFPAVPDNPNTGYALSAYAPEPRSAIKVLLYKHHHMLDEQWQAAADNQQGGYR